MRWTRIAGLSALLVLLPGCATWVGSRVSLSVGYAETGRPAPGYYCYDCHGYRYLDPYYDWCPQYGFRFQWSRHPDAVRAYRQGYVRIKQQNPAYGRYRYRTGYREARSYRQPQDYEAWRSGGSKGAEPGGLKVREKSRREPGTHKEGRTKGKEPEQQPPTKPRNAWPGSGK